MMDNALRAIIVEDSAADAELVLHEIHKNYTVEHALVDNANDLKKVLNEKPWDVVLCDYSMPEFDPYRAVDILREYEMDIPLICISGTIGEEKAIKLLKAGCSDCILKGNLTRLPGVIDREIKEALVRKENRALSKKLQKYKILADEANDAILFIDTKGKILDANLSAITKYGYGYEELLTLNIADLRREDDLSFVETQMKIAEDKGMLFEAIHYRKDGSSFDVEVSSQGSVYEDKKILISIIRDISERKKAEAEIKRERDTAKMYLDTAGVMFVALDSQKKVTLMNKKGCEILGYREGDIIGENWIDKFIPESNAAEVHHVFELIMEGKLDKARFHENPVVTANGMERLISWHNTILRDEAENIVGLLSSGNDITEAKEAEGKLMFQSYHDQLTGLYNRRFFEEELTRLDIRRNRPLSIIMGDINGLKLINDSFGHARGDDYLKKTARIIKEVCRADDIIARLGGDEFVILLPKANEFETTTIIRRIEDEIAKETIAGLELSVSFGYGIKEKEEQTISMILANAENDMYRRKIYEHTSMRSKAVDLIMNTLFEKSNRESQHSKRVSEICAAIASKMNFGRDEANQIKIAGLIHDIGKIGIDENILNKVESLSEHEWVEIRKHPEAGWRILKATNEFSEVAQIVLHHHEKFDGGGYPTGIKGEEIPIESRIIAVADAYDAMTSERSYRKGISKEKAMEEITRCAGTHFDPEITDVFINQVVNNLEISVGSGRFVIHTENDGNDRQTD